MIMKRFTFIATALIALASCSESEFVGENTSQTSQTEQGTIAFGSYAGAITRADYTGSDAAAKLNNNFVVEGVKWNGSGTQEVVFDHYNVNWQDNTANTTTSNTANWEYVAQTKHAYGPAGAQAIKYWDYAKSQYDFIAYSVGTATPDYTSGVYVNTKVKISEIDVTKMNGVDSNGDNIIDQGAYTLKGTAENLAKCYIADLVTAYRPDDYQKEVDITFRPLSAKVRIGLYETVPGYSVKDVVFYKDNGSGTIVIDTPTEPETWGNAHLYTTGTEVFNTEGTYTVYFPTTGADKAPGKTGYDTDYNKAHLAFAAEASGTSKDKAFGGKLTGSLTAANLAAEEVAEASGNYYLGRSSSAAIYAGAKSNNYYTIVLPNETGAALNLKVDYTLLSTDGSGEVIKVTGATAQVPAVYATWKSGYAYTYLFKISQNTNGLTNPDISVAGLYPVTFDAIVVNDEVDNTQETITTVATPSITTYAKGTVVTENNEYKKGSYIYFLVDNGTTLTASNAKMYKVELEPGAAQTINEASVANAIKNGGSGSPYTVTDANGKKMTITLVGLTIVNVIPATDSPNGNAIPVNGARFNTGFANTYAFEYTDGSGNKYYKIIKVVN